MIAGDFFQPLEPCLHVRWHTMALTRLCFPPPLPTLVCRRLPTLPPTHSQHMCIVDPRFREQFQVGHPTPAYTQLLKVRSALALPAAAMHQCSLRAHSHTEKEGPAEEDAKALPAAMRAAVAS